MTGDRSNALKCPMCLEYITIGDLKDVLFSFPPIVLPSSLSSSSSSSTELGETSPTSSSQSILQRYWHCYGDCLTHLPADYFYGPFPLNLLNPAHHHHHHHEEEDEKVESVSKWVMSVQQPWRFDLEQLIKGQGGCCPVPYHTHIVGNQTYDYTSEQCQPILPSASTMSRNTSFSNNLQQQQQQQQQQRPSWSQHWQSLLEILPLADYATKERAQHVGDMKRVDGRSKFARILLHSIHQCQQLYLQRIHGLQLFEQEAKEEATAINLSTNIDVEDVVVAVSTQQKSVAQAIQLLEDQHQRIQDQWQTQYYIDVDSILRNENSFRKQSSQDRSNQQQSNDYNNNNNNNPGEYAYYQCSSGAFIFLHPLYYHCLAAHYQYLQEQYDQLRADSNPLSLPQLLQLPSNLTAIVTHIEAMKLGSSSSSRNSNADNNQQNKQPSLPSFLRWYLPLYTDVYLVDIDIQPLVDPKIYTQFSSDILRRQERWQPKQTSNSNKHTRKHQYHHHHQQQQQQQRQNNLFQYHSGEQLRQQPTNEVKMSEEDIHYQIALQASLADTSFGEMGHSIENTSGNQIEESFPAFSTPNNGDILKPTDSSSSTSNGNMSSYKNIAQGFNSKASNNQEDFPSLMGSSNSGTDSNKQPKKPLGWGTTGNPNKNGISSPKLGQSQLGGRGNLGTTVTAKYTISSSTKMAVPMDDEIFDRNQTTNSFDLSAALLYSSKKPQKKKSKKHGSSQSQDLLSVQLSED
jgi:hypothetical protein